MWSKFLQSILLQHIFLHITRIYRYHKMVVINQSSTTDNLRSWHSTKLLKQYMADFSLGDSWRFSNLSSREYTYFSPLHQSFSRLDLLLISKVPKTTIHPVIISDHATVSLSIRIESDVKYSSHWCFNTSLLKDSDFTALIQRE